MLAFAYNSLYLKAGPSAETVDFDQALANALNVSQQNMPTYLTMGLRKPLEMGILSFIVLVVFIDYGFIGYVVLKIHHKMKENVNRSVSKKAESTQRQVSRIMFVQVSVGFPSF